MAGFTLSVVSLVSPWHGFVTRSRATTKVTGSRRSRAQVPSQVRLANQHPVRLRPPHPSLAVLLSQLGTVTWMDRPPGTHPARRWHHVDWELVACGWLGHQIAQPCHRSGAERLRPHRGVSRNSTSAPPASLAETLLTPGLNRIRAAFPQRRGFNPERSCVMYTVHRSKPESIHRGRCNDAAPSLEHG